MNTKRFFLEKPWVTIEFKPSAQGYSADVRAWRVVAEEQGGGLLYCLKDWQSSGDWTPDTEQAEIFLDGFLKWDGCIELNMPVQQHFCGRKSAAELGETVAKIYELAPQVIEHWSQEVSE